MKLTSHLKNFLSHHQTQLTNAEYADLETETMRLVNVYIGILLSIPVGPKRAQKIHQLIEEQNELNQHVPTSCFKGCGACCHLEVEITEDEARLLVQEIQTRKIIIDSSHLENQAGREPRDPAWKARQITANRCVFLNAENCCVVYDVRPMICRKHSVVSPAFECMSEDGIPIPRLIPINEIIASAVINLPGIHYESLSKMLFRELKKQEAVHQIHNLEIVETDEITSEEKLLQDPRPSL